MMQSVTPGDVIGVISIFARKTAAHLADFFDIARASVFASRMISVLHSSLKWDCDKQGNLSDVGRINFSR